MTFGSNISVANWESVRRVAEEVVKHLFLDTTLRTKHREILDKLRWSKPADTTTIFTQAKADAMNSGVLDEFGEPVPTPHHYFVDDGVYADVAIRARLEQTIAAGIESIYLLLGEPDLSKRQNSCELDKLYDMMVSYSNKVLGHILNTRTMEVMTPPLYFRYSSSLKHGMGSTQKTIRPSQCPSPLREPKLYFRNDDLAQPHHFALVHFLGSSPQSKQSFPRSFEQRLSCPHQRSHFTSEHQ